MSILKLRDVGPFSRLFLPLFILRPCLDPLFGLMRLGGDESKGLSPGFLYNLLVISLAGLFVLRALLARSAQQRHVMTMFIAWGPFLFFAVIAEFRSPTPVSGIPTIFNYLVYAATVVVALVYGERMTARQLTGIVLLSGVIPIAYGLVHFPFAYSGPHYREQSTFPHPNIFSLFLMVYSGFLFHAILSFELRGMWLRWAIPPLILASFVLIMLTGTRSVMLASVVFFGVYSLIRRPILLVPMIAFAAVALLIPSVSHRALDAFNGAPVASYARYVAIARGQVDDSVQLAMDSGLWRKFLWGWAWTWIVQRPVLGYGLESFPYYATKYFPFRILANGAHNDFVQLQFEGGAILLLSYIYIFAYTNLRVLTSYNKITKNVIYSVISSISLLTVSASDNVLHYLNVLTFFWFIIFSLVKQEGYVAITYPSPSKMTAGRNP